MMRFLLPVILVGCGTTPSAEPGFDSSDTRIDRAQDFDPDSASSQTCASGERVYVVWVDDRDGTPGVWLNASSDGGATWQPEAVAINGDPAAALNPSLACDGARVYVAWEDARDGELAQPAIYFTRSDNGGDSFVWPERIDFATQGRYPSHAPQVAAVGDQVNVTWFNYLYGAPDVYVATSLDGGRTFVEPLRLDSDNRGETWSGYPKIAANAEAVHVVWEDHRNGGADLYTAMSTDGGLSFTEDQRIDGGLAGASDSQWAQIALDGSQAWVVWHDQRDGEGFGVYGSWFDGASWLAEAFRVDEAQPGMYDSLRPQLVAFAGRAHVAWEDDRLGMPDVRYRTLSSGGLQGEEVHIDTNDSVSQARNPRLVEDGDAIAVVWEDTRWDTSGQGTNDLYYRYSSDDGATWSAEDFQLNSYQRAATYAVDPHVQLVDGQLLASWTDGRGGTADIYFHRLGLGFEAPTPE
jgi:hypothetical protein